MSTQEHEHGARKNRGAWRRWRFAFALNVAVIPWVTTITPHSAGSALLVLRHDSPTHAGTYAGGATSVTTTSHPSTSTTLETTITAGHASTTLAHVLSSSPTHRVAVGITRCTFVDPTRPVYDYSRQPAVIRSTHRTLLTEIRYPISAVSGSPTETTGATPLARRGGYPVIVFAHGYDVSPDTYAALLDDWARAGFVVVAPFFPDEKHSAVTAQGGADTEGDLANEPGDVAFVTRQVLKDSTQVDPSCALIHGLADPAHIALAGQSDGANTVATLAYNRGLDPQGVPFARLDQGLDIQAIVILSGQEAPHQAYAAAADAPSLLMVQSLNDQCNSIRSAVTLYQDVHQSDKWFLELQTAHHLPPYDGIDKPAFRIVVATTVHFLVTSLGIARLSTGLVAFANQNPAIALMFQNQQGPPLTNVPPFTGLCGLN